MASANHNILIKSTWSSDISTDDFVNKIVWKDEICEITEIVTAENSFQLKRKENEPAQYQLSISLKNDRCFKNIIILSEESVIEVRGRHEEYLETSRGTLLDDVEGTLLFENKIDLQNPSPDVTLNFCRSRESLWVYGLLAVTEASKTIPKPAAFPELPITPSLQLLFSSMAVGKDRSLEPAKSGTADPATFEQLEQRLMKRIDDRLKNLEDKIDQQFTVLFNLLKAKSD